MIRFAFLPYETVLALTVSVSVLLILLALKKFLRHQLQRLNNERSLNVLGYAEQLVRATRVPFMIGLAGLCGVSQMELPLRWERWLGYAWIIILVAQIAIWGNRLITVAVQRAVARQSSINPASATHLSLAGLVGQILLWSIALLVTLDNLGFNVSTLMASLGIGGIAVALAVQNILGDIFSSVSIALDKPFVIGDFIVVDAYMGTVEHVGMKTTRLRSLGGEQIIISNTELLKNRIRNFKRMQERRAVFEFGVAFDTPIELLEKMPTMLKTIIAASAHPTRFDRAHFKSIGDGALQFEVVYFVLDPDFNMFMDIQQAINLALLRQCRTANIAITYPGRTITLAASTEPIRVALA
ncbi:small-conductance mechanosensitive channel [Actimicrobium sp. GrIS 1.19]|uniref:mechanosensitive ion channel family protein n=1 Tax=Actimicrobium sp. GrIS 1.19 TaxID=3071708 RepID=UPI002E08E08A|nr:small-conductance mechanosensitive channel [Actimicrobium sp. GrIS 1.19]